MKGPSRHWWFEVLGTRQVVLTNSLRSILSFSLDQFTGGHVTNPACHTDGRIKTPRYYCLSLRAPEAHGSLLSTCWRKAKDRNPMGFR